MKNTQRQHAAKLEKLTMTKIIKTDKIYVGTSEISQQELTFSNPLEPAHTAYMS